MLRVIVICCIAMLFMSDKAVAQCGFTSSPYMMQGNDGHSHMTRLQGRRATRKARRNDRQSHRQGRRDARYAHSGGSSASTSYTTYQAPASGGSLSYSYETAPAPAAPASCPSCDPPQAIEYAAPVAVETVMMREVPRRRRRIIYQSPPTQCNGPSCSKW